MVVLAKREVAVVRGDLVAPQQNAACMRSWRFAIQVDADEVAAVTGKRERHDLLKSLGASSILSREDAREGARKPLLKEAWGGVVDTVGGEILVNGLKSLRYGCSLAACGLVDSPELSASVLPFILRAVCLLGINSVDTPRDLRLAVWQRIGADLRPRHLDKIAANTITFDELPGAFQAFIDGKVTGRTVVEIGG